MIQFDLRIFFNWVAQPPTSYVRQSPYDDIQKNTKQKWKVA